MIFDTHVHAWNAEGPDTPWRAGWRAYAPRPSLTVDRLLQEMDAAGVDAAALIPPEWDARGDELTLAAAERHPGRIVAFPALSLRDPASRERLDDWRARPGFGGLRQVFLEAPGYTPLRDGTAEWLLRAADELGLTLMVWLPGQLDLLPDLLDRHPGARLVVDHVDQGMEPGVAALEEAATTLAALADRPNLAVKASALPASASDGYPYRSTHRAVRILLDAFGPARVFWGSDFARLPCDYREAVGMVAEIEGLDDHALDALRGDAFAAYIGFQTDNEKGGSDVG